LFINQDMYSLSLSKCSKSISNQILHQVIRRYLCKHKYYRLTFILHRAPGLINLDLSACKKVSFLVVNEKIPCTLINNPVQ